MFYFFIAIAMRFIKTLKSLTYNEPKSRAKYYCFQKFFRRPKCHKGTFTKTENQDLIKDANNTSLKRKQLVLQSALVKKSDVKKLPNRLTLGQVYVIL